MAGREEQGESASHAKADDADLARAALLASEPSAHGLNLVERPAAPGLHVAENRSQALYFPAPVEEVGRPCQVSFARQPIGLVPEVASHSHDVVENHDTRPRRAHLGLCYIEWQLG